MVPGDCNYTSPEWITDIMESGKAMREYHNMNLLQKIIWYLKGNRIGQRFIIIKGPTIRIK